MNDDGTPYRITDGWFRGSLLLDFSNLEAVDCGSGSAAFCWTPLASKVSRQMEASFCSTTVLVYTTAKPVKRLTTPTRAIHSCI